MQGIWTVAMVYWSIINSSEIGQWVLRAGALAGLISLAHMVVRRNYFEIAGNKLIVNESIFSRKIIELDQIEKFDYEPGPFKSSKIILKDKSVINYQDSQTEYKRLKEFMLQFNIQVE